MCLQRLKIDPEASKKSAASLKVDKIEESIDQVKQDIILCQKLDYFS